MRMHRAHAATRLRNGSEIAFDLSHRRHLLDAIGNKTTANRQCLHHLGTVMPLHQDSVMDPRAMHLIQHLVQVRNECPAV